jgi:hypothetical protein
MQRRVEDHQLIVMEDAFRATGGLVSSNEIARRLRKGSNQPISIVANWIVAREIISLDWQSTTRVPLFQFEPPTMILRPGVTRIIRELSAVFDDWDLALWFATPNAWIFGRTPLEVFDRNERAVLEAARADRFIACGRTGLIAAPI